MGWQQFDDVASDFNRLTMLLYGEFRVGKTELCLKLLEGNEILYYFPIDKGIRTMLYRKQEEKKKMLVSTETSYEGILSDVNSLTNRIIAQTSKKNDGYRRWVIVDTATQMQSNLLSEARKVQTAGTNNPNVQNKQQRAHVTQTDWGINLAWMTQIVQMLIQIPCNIVFITLEAKDHFTGKACPMLQGATAGRLPGSCDIIARLVRDGKKGRVLHCVGNEGMDGGTRGWELDDVEPADLVALRDKFLHRSE